MKPFLLLVGVAISILLFNPCAVCAADAEKKKDLTEDQKIDSLIATVEKLADAKFIRNGKEYDCKAAADHMRSKRKQAGDKIKTARDFIEKAASKSWQSGQPYKIKFKDGKEQTSGEFLTKELDKLEGKDKDSTKK